MCGIIGIQTRSGSVRRSELIRACKRMQHRGPDSGGSYVAPGAKTGLAMVRLAIVDPTSRANQPMAFDDGAITIVFNGEIFNYRELRAELESQYVFKTKSDTEVLGRLYQAYGVAMLGKLDGQFAFALYDRKKRSLFLARDTLGQKPLVYCADERGFAAASELPALLAARPDAAAEIDEAAIGVFLTPNFSHIPAPFTAFRRCKKLLPGHYLIVRDGAIVEQKQYWRLRKQPVERSDESQFLCDTIEHMKPTDVSFSSFLSGGTDSSFVCAALRQSGAVDAYTLSVRPGDTDTRRAKLIAKELKLDQRVIPFDPERFLKSVDEQVSTLGEPYYHITSVYADQLLAQVRKKHKVIFTGAGGDEVYYGYDNAQFLIADAFFKVQPFLPAALVRAALPRKYAFLAGSTVRTVKVRLYKQEYDRVKQLLTVDKRDVYAHHAEIVRSVFSLVELSRYIDVSYMTGLFVENNHSLTIQADLVGMKNSVEVRCPFLEKRVVERGYSLPLRAKLGLNLREGKRVLKRGLRRFLPRSLVDAKKIGFGVELNGYGSLVSLHGAAIRRRVRALATRPQFDADAIRALVDGDEVLTANFVLVMKLYSLAGWLEASSPAGRPVARVARTPRDTARKA